MNRGFASPDIISQPRRTVFCSPDDGYNESPSTFKPTYHIWHTSTSKKYQKKIKKLDLLKISEMMGASINSMINQSKRQAQSSEVDP